MDAKTAIQKIQQFNGLLDDELVGEISSLLQNQQAEIAKKDRMLAAAEKVCAVKFIKRTIRDNPKQFQCPHCANAFIHYDTGTQMDLPYCGNCGRAILDAADNHCGVCGVKLEWQEVGR